MEKKFKKRLLFILKLVIAAILLFVVLSQAHLDNYVCIKKKHGGGDGTVSLNAVTGDMKEIEIQRGFLWWKTSVVVPVEHLEPTFEDENGFHYVRPGIISSLGNMNVGLFILGVVGFPLSLLVIAFRLKYMLRFQDVHISTWESIKLTFMGHFFNSVIPGMVGGDLVKAWYLFRPDRRVGVVVVTVLVDRLLGLCEMVILSAVMVAIVLGLGFETIERMHTPLISVSVLVTAVILALAFLLSRRLRKLFHLEKIYGRTSIAHHFRAAGRAAGIYRKNPLILVGGLLITIVAHIFFIGAIAMVGFSLRVDVSWYNYLVYIPLIYIIGSVPVTPGGVGLIENLYLGFLAGATVSSSADLSSIIALAILVRFLLMAWGLPGLPVAIAGRKLPSAEELEEEIQRAELAEEKEALEQE